MNAIERRVLETIGEDPDSPDVFTDTDTGIAPIRDAVNDAIQEIAMVAGGNKRQYLLPLRSGTMFYRFRVQNGYLGWVTDAWDVTRQARLKQTSATKLSNRDPRWMVGTGYPECYLQHGEDVIGFYKKPSASTNVIELTIVEIPRPYETDTENVYLRDSFHNAAVHYAVSDYWATRGDANEASNHYNQYLGILGIRDKHEISSNRVHFRSTREQ